MAGYFGIDYTFMLPEKEEEEEEEEMDNNLCTKSSLSLLTGIHPFCSLKFNLESTWHRRGTCLHPERCRSIVSSG